jgi:hypothetical protein
MLKIINCDWWDVSSISDMHSRMSNLGIKVTPGYGIIDLFPKKFPSAKIQRF